MVAFCTNKPQYNNNNCQKEDYCNYPGMKWLSLLYKELEKDNIKLVSGDIALELVKKNKINVNKIYILQEENSKHGKNLISLGAKPFLLYSWESPIYAPMFYDKLKFIAPKFKNRVFFNFAFELFNSKYGEDHIMFFPTFSDNDKFYNKEWKKKNFLVMVSANKTAKRKLFENKTLKEYIYYIYKYLSPTFRNSIKKELHNERINILLYFKNKISLFGSLWDNLNNLETSAQAELKQVLKIIKPTFCKNKIKTISNYKFCICAENVDYHGYITEKIIDCFLAGTIPIYIGTSMIRELIPNDTYIEYSKFNDLNDLNNYLNHIDEKQASIMVKKAQKFLKTENGNKFSNEYFVKKIISLMKDKKKDAI